MSTAPAKLCALLSFLLLALTDARAGIITAVYNSAADVPVTSAGDYNATGIVANFTLNFAPPIGTNLTVVQLTGLGKVTGTFAAMPQGHPVRLGYAGQEYSFVLNYSGGTGNDIVLQWANTRALAWGNDDSGQLGDGVLMGSNLPVAVTPVGAIAGKAITAMAAGGSHTLALCSDGTLAAWGSNAYGQTGPGNFGSSNNVPVVLSGLGALSTRRVIAVAAGENHSLALCSDGSVVAWGYNASGQLGNGGTTSAAIPTLTISPGTIAAIAAGQNHSVALRSDGKVFAWGNNAAGQLGRGNTTNSGVPVQVNPTGVLAGKIVAAIAAGQSHCLAVCSDGTLAAWGANADGQLGNDTTTLSNVPVAVTTKATFIEFKSVTSISAGGFHSMVLCSDGTVAAWGKNTAGQLGTTSGSNLLPAAVSTTGALLNKTVTGIAAGLSHSLAQCSDGTLTAWGDELFGQLGTGVSSSSPVPVNVSTSPLFSGEKFAVAFSGPSGRHSLGIVASPPLPGSLTLGTLISNGSFESGFTNWSVSDITGPFIPVKTAANEYLFGGAPFGVRATHGNYAAVSGFGGSGPSVIRFAHDVPVTAAEPFVRFDWRAGWDLSSPSFTKARTFAVTIEPAGGGPVLQRTVFLTAAPQTKNLDAGMQTSAVDLSAFTGTTVRVCFDLTVPESLFAQGLFQLDNVRTAALLPATANPITLAATAPTLHGATLNGTVNAGGLNTTVQFEYGTTAAYGNAIAATPSPVTGSADTAVSATPTGLPINTTYHYRVKTTDGTGVKVGADATFTTLPNAPFIQGFGISLAPSSSRVGLYATVNPYGADTTVTFEYGPTTAYGSTSLLAEDPATAHLELTGLTGGVEYHWRVKARNAGGTVYSADATFTTPMARTEDPTVTTLQPTHVDRSHAQLNGTVNANGFIATSGFEFSTNPFYGSPYGAYPYTVSGVADNAVSLTIDVSPGTTYHCRATATTQNGVVYGPDVTFTTPAIGFPAASTDAATNIAQTSVILHGWASANNGPATTVSFEYGPDANYGTVVTLAGLPNGNVQTQIPVSGDSVTYHYRVKATNNIGTTYGQDMTFVTPDSHEARLYGLTLGGGTLSPAFDRNVTAYTLSQPFETASIWVNPTASTAIGSVMVNGVAVTSGGYSDPVVLNVGSNVISIVVTALDGVMQRTYTVTVTRNAPVAGNLDLSFNGTGTVGTDLGGYNFIYGMTVQPDGKIVAVGAATNGNDDDFAVVRYNPDGTPDTTFGTGGKVTTDFANGSGDSAGSVAVQGDGKIVVAGYAGNGINTDFAVARYNADGTPDTTFNGNGRVITAFPHPPFTPGGASASSIAVQPDGKILLAGYAQNGTDNDFAIVRYHGDSSTGTPGTLDTTFGGSGMVVTDMGSDDFLTCMTLLADGKILVAGQTATSGIGDSALARYDSDGTLDTTFGGTGKVIAALSTDIDVIYGIAVQPDGKIVAAGLASNGSDYDFALARFHGDIATGSPGTLDTTFGSAGKVITAFGAGDDYATGVALQPDGKIVVCGTAHNGSNRIFAVLRHNADGTLDTTFHGDGRATADFGSNDEGTNCMALQSDGKILVAGSMVRIFNDFAIARFLGDGPAINVQTAPATNIFDGIGSVQFPGALPGANSSVAFTIQNTGTANLTGLGITFAGAGASAFDVTANPVAPVTPFAATTFTVRFSPTSPGAQNAIMHIASNVTGSNGSYDIALTGTGLTVLENWRQQFFGSAANAGDAADTADPYHTGIQNLAVFALLGPNRNPATAQGSQLPQAQLSGGNLAFNFTQPDGMSGVTYGAEWRPDLLTGDWMPVPDTGSGGGHIFRVPVEGYPSLFMRLKVTCP